MLNFFASIYLLTFLFFVSFKANSYTNYDNSPVLSDLQSPLTPVIEETEEISNLKTVAPPKELIDAIDLYISSNRSPESNKHMLDMLQKHSRELCGQKAKNIACKYGNITSLATTETTLLTGNEEMTEYEFYPDGTLKQTDHLIIDKNSKEIYTSTKFNKDGFIKTEVDDRSNSYIKETYNKKDKTTHLEGGSAEDLVEQESFEQQSSNSSIDNVVLYNHLKPHLREFIDCDTIPFSFSEKEFDEKMKEVCDDTSDPIACLYSVHSYHEIEEIASIYQTACDEITSACGELAKFYEGFRGTDIDDKRLGLPPGGDEAREALIFKHYEQAYEGKGSDYAGEYATLLKKDGQDQKAIMILKENCIIVRTPTCNQLKEDYPKEFEKLPANLKNALLSNDIGITEELIAAKMEYRNARNGFAEQLNEGNHLVSTRLAKIYAEENCDQNVYETFLEKKEKEYRSDLIPQTDTELINSFYPSL